MLRGAFRWVVPALACVLAGCGASTPVRPVKLVVTPPGSLLDTPVRLDLSGLKPGQLATVQLRSVDAAGTAWASTTTFAADAHGAVDTSHQAPVVGAYRGISTTGIVFSMQPDGGSATTRFTWPGDRPVRYAVTVRVAGHQVAATTLRRQFSVVPLTERPITAGFRATLFSAGGTQKRPAIVMVGDGAGVTGPLLARLLATKGYSVLAIDAAGAGQLTPVAGVARAVRWLDRQPRVAANRVLTFGIGRGSEAALRAAVKFPGLIHGVIVASPSSAVAGIPVQKIRGPVLVACGEDEGETSQPSCRTAVPILSRLQAAHDRYQHLLYGYPGAGPAMGQLVPNEPFARAADPAHYESDQLGTAQLWPHLLQFMGVAASGGVQQSSTSPSAGS
jgi:dienelactone hydrolase